MKLRTLVAGILMAMTFGLAQAQPVWAPTPTIASVGALNVTVNFGINVSGTVYIIIFNSNVTTALTSAYVRTQALGGPSGGMVGAMAITVTAGQANLTLSQYFALLNSSRAHAMYIVAANSSGTLQADPIRIAFTTLACPSIKLKTYFGNLGECVNNGAVGYYSPSPLPSTPTGVLAGTTWTVDWGDGTIWNYTSTADDDIPDATHTYTTITDCNFVGFWTVQNPCGEFLNASGVFVVHGRETPDDGDGDIMMTEPVTGDVDITYVCEGIEHNLVVQDETTWNCQDPDVPDPLVAIPNTSLRTIQFVYGETPAGAIMNDITGDVLIAGTNIANLSNGYVGPVQGPFAPPNPNTVSDVITIPATCVAGERFYVYLKYWNKCNPFVVENLDYVDDFFIIEVIEAPDPPVVVSPQTYCYGDVPTTISATPNTGGNTINWYSDAALTNLLHTGATFTHGKTDVGTYTFYVTESVGVAGCEGPAAPLTLIIIPGLNNNIISADQSICNNTVPATLTGLVPTGGSGSYTYLWQYSTTSSTGGFSSAPGANTGQNYTPPSAITNTRWYRRAASSGICTNYSNVIQVTVYPGFSPGTIKSAQSICYNTTPATLTQNAAPSGGEGSYTFQWQSSTDNSTWSNLGVTTSSYSPPALTVTTYYRRIVTDLACGSLPTPSVRITVYGDLDAGEIGTSQSICYNTAPPTITETDAPSGGDGTYYYRWYRSTNGTSWTQIGGATSATYTSGALTVNTYFRRRVNNTCGTVYTDPVLFTVLGQLTAGSVGSPQTICYNTAPAQLTELTAATGGMGTYTYQWQSSPNNSAWTSITGAQSITYSPGALVSNTYFRRVVTSGTCGSANSASVLITVRGELTAGTVGPAQSICYNTAPSTLNQIAAPGGGTGSYTYQWQVSLNNTAWSDISGATSSSYSPGALTVNTYYRRNVTSGVCGSVLGTSVLITVYPNLTPGSIGNAQTICYNTAPLTLTQLTAPTGGSGVYSYQWQRSTDNISWSPISGATSSTYSPGALTTPTYYRRDVTSSTCGTVTSNTILISLYSTLTLAQLNSDISICANATTTFYIDITGGTSPYTVIYTRNGVTQTTISNYISGTPISTGPLPTGTYNYLLTSVTDSHGCSAQSHGTGITITAGTAPSAATFTGSGDICFNTAAYLTSTITGGGAPYTLNITGLSTSPVTNYYSGDNIDLGVLAPGTYSYILTSVADNCGVTLTAGLPKTHTFTVFDQLKGGTIATAQTICYNSAPAGFTNPVSPTGGTALAYMWQKSPAGAGTWSDISGATGLVYTETNNLTASTDYRRVTTSGNGCGTVYSNVITVTVYGELTPGSVGSPQTICYNATPAGLSQTSAPTGGTGSYTYQWQSSTDNFTWSDINLATSSTYSPGVLTVTTYFRRNVTSGSCGTVPGASVKITVYPDFAPGTIGSAQSICYNTAPATLTELTAPSGGTGSYTYQWQISSDNTNWSNLTGANLSTYTPGALTNIRYYRRNVTSGSCGTLNSPSVKITVYANLTPGSVGSPQAICYNTAPTALTQLSNPTGGTGTYTYQWQRSTDNSTWSDINLATASTYSPGAQTSSIYYRRNVTSGSCGTVSSASVYIIVYADFTPGSIETPQSICYNTIPAGLTQVTAPAGASGTYVFQWQSSPDNTNWSNITGASLSGYSPGTLTVSTYFRRNVTSGSCGTLSSNPVLITVYGNLTPGTIGNNQTICYNTVPSPLTELTAPAGGTGVYDYQWQISSNNSTWSDLSGESSAGYSPGALTGTRYYRRAVTSGTCGTVTSTVITITVYANLTPGSVGNAQNICYNTTPAALTELTIPSGGTGTYTYQWQRSTDNSTWSDINLATASTYSPGTLTSSIYYRRNVTSGTCGTVSSPSVYINVYPVFTPGSVGSPETICENAAPAALTQLTAPTGGTGTYTYQWQNSADNSTWVDISGALSANYSPGALVTNTYFRRNVTSGSCGTLSSPSVLITVTKLPVISDQSADVCSGETLSHIILLDNYTNPGDNVTFVWLAPTLSAGLTGGTARSIPSPDAMTDVFVNTTGTVQTATYYVTPYYNGCAGAQRAIVVTIGSQPVLANNLDRSVCSRLATGLILAVDAASVPATSYNVITIDVEAGLVPDAGNVVAANGVTFDYLDGDIFTNKTGADKAVTYTVRPVYGGACIGDPAAVVVTVHPEPVIVPGQKQTVCSNVASSLEILLDPLNAPTATVFNWNVPVMSDGSTQGTAGASVNADPAAIPHITDVFVNYGINPITATYSVTPLSADNCTGDDEDVVLTINPEPAAPVISGPDTLCVGETSIVYSVPLHSGSTYTWTVPAAIGIKTFDMNSNAIIITAASAAGTGFITVTETNSYGCTGLAGSYEVVVMAPWPASPISGANSLCAFESATYSVPAHSGSTYIWTIPPGAALLTDPDDASITVVFSTISGNISVREINPAGCITNHGPLPVTVNPNPTVVINNPVGVCSPATVDLTAAAVTSGSTAGLTYTYWTDAAATVTYATPGAATAGTYYILGSTADGCYDIQPVTVTVNPVPTLVITNPAAVCSPGTVNLTSAAVTAGSSVGLTYSYWTDVAATAAYASPFTAGAGTYYIKGTTLSGCYDIKPVTVTVNASPTMIVTNPAAVCTPATVDLTAASVTSGSTPGLTYTYWTNAGATTAYATPSAATTGTYYIKGTTIDGCYDIKPVMVIVNPTPVVVITDPAAVCSPGTVNMMAASVTTGSTPGLTYTYWTDAAATLSFTTPASATTGTYYIKGTTSAGCYDIKPVNITVNTTPAVLITDPAAVCSPLTVDLTDAAVTFGSTAGLTYTYWTDPAATAVYPTPSAATAGTYFIKGTAASGCYNVKPVTVSVNPLPTLVTNNPAAVCAPATVDLTSGAITSGSTPGLSFTYWTDASATVPYATPFTATAGTYYIKGTTSAGCYDIKPVTVTVNPTPLVAINNPAAVCSPATVDLTAAAITSGSTPGLIFTYWTNPGATVAYITPAAATAGTYYIKGTTLAGCYEIKAVVVTVNPTPTVVITNPVAVCSPGTVNLTAAAITSGSTPGLTYTYWTNAGATASYLTPSAAPAGIYYIKGTTPEGCYDIKPVTVTVNTTPLVVITDPADVCSPATVDLTAAAVTFGSTVGLTFTYWYDAAATVSYTTPATAGTGTYYIKGTTIAGCFDIKPVNVTVNPTPTVVITSPAAVCSPATVDITVASVTSGSTVGLAYTYWTDASATTSYTTPASATAGTYYIKGTTAAGCYDIKPVTVTVNPTPLVITNNPAAVCSPGTVNLMAPAVTLGSAAGLTFSYWTDIAATVPYFSPAAATAGTYYIKGTTLAGCYDIKPVTVTVNPLPTVVISNPDAVCSPATVDLTAAAITASSTAGLTYTYWTDAGATAAYSTPSAATAGTYFIKGTTLAGCYDIKPVMVTVNLTPTVYITNPAVVCSPATVNLTVAAVTSGSTPGLTYTYWTDPAATAAYSTPAAAPAGTYYIKGTTSAGCYDIKPVTVTVNPPPTVIITDPAAVCSPGTVNLMAAAVSLGSTPGLTFTYWTDAGATLAYPTPSSATAGTYYIKGTTSAGCYDIKPVTVTVNPTPVVVITNPDAVCSPLTVDLTATAVTSGSTAGLTFTYWTNAVATAAYLTPATATAGTYYIKGTTLEGCSDIKSVTVTVDPTPLVIVTNPAAVCFPGTVNLTTPAVTIGSTAGLTYSYFTDAAATVSYPTPASATAGTYYIRGTTIAGCYDIKPVTVTVNPLPVAEISGIGVICPGDPAVVTVAITTGASPYNVILSDGTTVTGYLSGDNITVYPSVTTIYTISSITDNNGCAVTAPHANLTGQATITVNSAPYIATQPADLTICEDDPAIFTVDAGVTLNPTYQWYYNSGSGMQILTGETNATLSLTATSSMNGNKYEVVVSGDCPPSVTSDAATLTVKEKPEILSGPSDITLCSGEDAILTVDAGVTTNPRYQWYVNTGSGWNVATGARYQGATTNTLTIVSVLELMSGYQYLARVIGDCLPYVETTPVTLTVTRQAEITQQPVNQTVCEGTSASFTVNAGITTGPSYQWETSTDFGVTWNPISGANSATYQILTVTTAMNNSMYRVVVSSSCGSSVTSQVIYLTVNELPEITTPPADVTVCEGAIADFTVDAGNTSGALYTWKISTDNGGTWTNLAESSKYFGVSSSDLKINGATSIMSGHMFRVIVTGTCPPSVTSVAATLTVNTAPEITDQPDPASICETNNASFTVVAQGTALAYQWYVDQNDGNGFVTVTNAGVYSGANSETLTLTSVPVSYDNYQYRVTVSGACNPPAYSNIVSLDVAVTTNITKQPSDKTICEFGAVSFDVEANGADLTYQWQVNNGFGWSNVSNNGTYMGALTNEITIFGPSRIMSGYRYKVIVGSKCAAEITSLDALLTINTSPLLTDQPDNVKSCPGSTVTYSVAASGTGLSYQWQVNSGSGFVDVTDVAPYSGTTTSTLTITNLTLGMNSYLVRAVVSGTCLPSVMSSYATLTVYPEPVIMTQPADAEVCDGNTVIYYSQVYTTAAGETMQWQVDDGTGWTDLTETGQYQGTTTPQLIVLNSSFAMNGWYYRLQVTGPCGNYYTNQALLTVNDMPGALISPSDTILICGGTALQLHGNPTGGSGSYSNHRWFGDVGPMSQYNIENPVFNTVYPGYYDLIYQVTDSKGCYGTDTVVVEVEKPVAMFNSDPSSGCEPLSVEFSNSSSGYTSLIWDFGDGETSTDVNPIHIYSNATSSMLYPIVSLTVTSSNGCTSVMQSGITIFPRALSDFVFSDDTICSGETASMISLPGGFNYHWKFGDGIEQDGANIVNHIFTNYTTGPVTYDVVLEATSFFGCTSSTTLPLVVYPVPLPAFTPSPVTQTIPNSTVTFTNSTTGTWSWLWRFGDGNNSTTESPVYTYGVAGTFPVTLIADNGVCSDSVSHSVNILPTPPIADFDSIPSGCKVWTISPHNTSLYATTYYWEFGDGSVSTAENPTYTYTKAGVYRVTLTVYGAGGNDSESQLVYVYEAPLAYFEISPTTVYVNDEKVRCFNLSEGAASYIWEFGDGDTSHIKDPYHKYTAEGIYNITLHAYSPNGCYDTYVLSPAVNVIPFGDLSFATVFRPNQGGEIDLSELPTSGDAVNQFFYPPIRETVVNYHLQIFNRWGTLIYEAFDINKPWNGYYKHKICPQGVYVWLVEGKYANGRPFKKVGDITLLH